MAMRKVLVGRVLAVGWRPPELEDLSAIVVELRAARARHGRKGLYLSVIGAKAIPQGAVREELAHFYREVLACCDSMHVVVAGSDFESSIKRSVIAGVLLVVQARGRVFIDNSLEGVIEASPVELRGELEEAARVAAAQGIFEYALG